MIRKGRWAAEEDEALRSAVESCGMTWKIVAQRVKGRTDAQCRERWVNTLDPKLLDSSQWSHEVRSLPELFLDAARLTPLS